MGEACYNVTETSFPKLIKSLLTQEANPDFYGIDIRLQYTHLGWVAFENEDGTSQLCYRCHKLIGGSDNGEYVGNYNVKPNGTFEGWQSMVQNEVLGNTRMEICLLAGLSAVVNGILGFEIPVENPIFSICGVSGSGKSTAGFLASSTMGKPFTSSESTPRGELRSVFQSWSSTEAAVTSSQAGVRGVISIFNELSTFEGRNMKSILYNFSEGITKQRLNAQMQAYVLPGYTTTFMSIGEKSIFSLVNEKVAGIEIRVLELEITDYLTTSANNAVAIKNGSVRHNGHAAPMVAQFILDNGGSSYVLDIYNKWKVNLNASFNKRRHTERFIEKFAALFACTMEISRQALNLDFNTEEIIAFFSEYNDTHGDLSRSEASSYEEVLRIFRDNKKHFKGTDEYRSQYEVWGFVKNINKIHKVTGKFVTLEITFRPDILERLLYNKGFHNVKSCVKAWKKGNVLNYEKDRNYRTRKIDEDIGEENAYVFYIFGKNSKQITAPEGIENVQ